MYSRTSDRVTSIHWTSYTGRSSDVAFSYVEVPDQSYSGTRKPYRCRICSRTYQMSSGAYNIRRHLDCAHHIQKNMKHYDEWKKDNHVDRKTTLSFRGSSKFDKNGVQQKRFIDKCARWVAKNNRPISIVEDDGFCELIHAIAPKLHNVSRRTVLRRIEELLKDVDSSCEAALNDAKVVSVTSDVWTDGSGSSYSSFTAHIIDNEWNLKSYLLLILK